VQNSDDSLRWLQRFESADLVHEYYVERHSKTPSATLKRSIVSSFRQGRQLFESSASTESLCRPITQFYAVSAICRGLTLVNKPGMSESALTPGHGLTISDFQTNLLEMTSMSLKAGNGLLRDLQQALGSAVYRVNSSGVNWTVPVPPMMPSSQLRFVELARLIPQVGDEVSQWTGEAAPPRIEVETITDIPESPESLRWTFTGQIDENELKRLFGSKNAVVDGMSVCAPRTDVPQLSQSYGSLDIGSVLLRQPLSDEIRLGDLSIYYIVSYTLSMIARYRPSVWMAVWSGGGGDRIMPFADSFMKVAQARFPMLAADFLRRTHESSVTSTRSA
jgi:hypothetical protein